jgi:uncharacterized protein (DUF362 family)
MNNSTHQIHEKPRVAVAKGDTREQAVRQAISLVRSDIVETVRGSVIIKPNLLSSTNPLASTQSGAVRPLLELLSDIHACNGESMSGNVVIAEGGTENTRTAFRNFGFEELSREFGIELVDLAHEPATRSFEAVTQTGDKHWIPFVDRAAEANTIISVAVAKTHDFAAVTLSLKNMMGCLKRISRPRMHGVRFSKAYENLGGALWNRLDDHPVGMKLVFGLVFGGVRVSRLIAQSHHGGGNPGLHMQIHAIAENLVRLGGVLMPHVAVIDAFEAMEGQGPGSGTPVKMGVAVAGTDPIACDAVMASMMGFDPLSIGYLALANERAIGVADLDKIDIVGENPANHRRSFVRHSNNTLHMRWRDAW